MTSSFINSFIIARQQQPVRNNAVIHPVQHTGIKPYAPKGHLVKENPVQAMGSGFKDLADSAKYFYDAINGKGTDYSVGRINDGATRLGSLGIAGVLSAGLSSRLGKGMEFIGFGCWFAAMSIWPKVFVGEPIKALTGIDLSQQYVDSQGRKKYFYQDPQYICWDLMPKQKIEKIGDKLGVPKNIENRQDAIKDKIKQIATQGNTLTMLTAGFSTPILASLMANYLRFPLGDAIQEFRIEKARLATGAGKVADANDISPIRKYISNPIARSLAHVSNLFSKSKANEKDILKVAEQLKQLDSSIDVNEFVKEISNNETLKKLVQQKVKFDKNYTALIGDQELTKIAKAWTKVPERVLDALGVKKTFGDLTSLTEGQHLNTNRFVDHLVKEFAGNEEKLKKAMQTIANHADAAALDVDKSAKILGKLNEEVMQTKAQFGREAVKIKGDKGKDVKKLAAKLQKLLTNDAKNLDIKKVNTKTSFYQFINLLDEIAKTDISVEGSEKQLKKNLAIILKGNAIDDVFNGLDNVDQDIANYSDNLGVLFRRKLSSFTENALRGIKGCADRITENNKSMLNALSGEITGENIKEIGNKLGKVGEGFVYEMTKESRLYAKWLKRVSIAGTALLGVTALAITRLGNTNKFNLDKYEFKGGNTNEC